MPLQSLSKLTSDIQGRTDMICPTQQEQLCANGGHVYSLKKGSAICSEAASKDGKPPHFTATL